MDPSTGWQTPGCSTNLWLAKYIFPGDYSPALSEVLPAVEKSRLRVTDLEALRLHYAMTIAYWRRRNTVGLGPRPILPPTQAISLGCAR